MSSHQQPMRHANDSDGIAATFEYFSKNSKGLEAAEISKTTVKVYFWDKENGGHGKKKLGTRTRNGGGVENKPCGGACGGASSSCCYCHAVANNMHGCPNGNESISCPNGGYFPVRSPPPGYWGFVAPPPWVAVGVPVPSAPPLPDDYYSPALPPPPPGTNPPHMMFHDDNTSSMCTIQ